MGVNESESTKITEPDKGCNFQNIDEWMKAQDEIDAQLAAEKETKNENLPPLGRKKAKPVIDPNAVTLEQQAIREMGDGNWVGKLIEYRQAHPPLPGLSWKEATLTPNATPRFTYIVCISESSAEFNTSPTSFSAKKIAKQYAAKKAIDWLIENKYMPSDGSVKFPKPVLSPPPPRVKQAPSPPNVRQTLLQSSNSNGNNSPKPKDGEPTPVMSFTSQVPELCHRLGFNVPAYRISALLEGMGLWDAYADFGDDPSIEGKVGEVKNVYGKKNAKEECASVVVQFLKDIERQRVEAGKRKRLGSGSGEVGGQKTLKVEA